MVYLDNAATTSVDPQVIEEMIPYFNQYYYNTQANYSHAQKIRVQIEEARKRIAKLLNVKHNEIVFTSGATEANNTVLNHFYLSKKNKRLFCCTGEHSSIINYVKHVFNDNAYWLPLDNKGACQWEKIAKYEPFQEDEMVVCGWVNNEIGTINDIKTLGDWCFKRHIHFHVDATQYIGKLPANLSQYNISSLSFSSHKFHGPKGVGVLYIRDGVTINPIFYGGAHENNHRAGTLNVAGIMGMAKALELAYSNVDDYVKQVKTLKKYMLSTMKKLIKTPYTIYGDCESGSPYITYIGFKNSKGVCLDQEILLLNLDMEDICISGGSACASGSSHKSNILSKMGFDPDKHASGIRISFSHYTTKQDVDTFLKKLQSIIKKMDIH